MQILSKSLAISSSNCFLTALARGSEESSIWGWRGSQHIKVNLYLFWQGWRMKRELGVDMELEEKRNHFANVHQTQKRLVSASKRTWLLTLNFEYWLDFHPQFTFLKQNDIQNLVRVPSVYPSLWQNVSAMKDANLVCSRVVRASSQPLSRSPPPSTRVLTSSRRIWTLNRLRSCSSSLKWSAPRRRSARWRTQLKNRKKENFILPQFCNI